MIRWAKGHPGSSSPKTVGLPGDRWSSEASAYKAEKRTFDLLPRVESAARHFLTTTLLRRTESTRPKSHVSICRPWQPLLAVVDPHYAHGSRTGSIQGQVSRGPYPG